jgi:hypothetical protein
MAPTNIFVPGVPSIGKVRRRILLGTTSVKPAVTQPLNARLGFAGDSRSAGVGGTLPPYTGVVLWGLQGRYYLPPGYMQAVASQTIDQGGNSFVNQVPSIIAQKFDVLHVDIGVNQLSTVGAGAYGYGVVSALIKQIILSGVTFVIWKQTGAKGGTDGPGSTFDNERLIYNGLIATVQSDPNMALVKNNIVVAYTDDASFVPATMTVDNLHYTWQGTSWAATSSGAGASSVTALNSVISNSTLLGLYTDATNLLLAADNPQLTGTAGAKSNVSGFVPSTWTAASIVSSGLPAPVSDCFAHTASVTINGAPASQCVMASGTNSQGNGTVVMRTLTKTPTATLTVGKYYDGWIAFNASDCTGAETIGLNVNGATSLLLGNQGNSAPLIPGGLSFSGVMRVPAIQASGTAANFDIRHVFGATTCSASMRVGQPYMRQIPDNLV